MLNFNTILVCLIGFSYQCMHTRNCAGTFLQPPKEVQGRTEAPAAAPLLKSCEDDTWVMSDNTPPLCFKILLLEDEDPKSWFAAREKCMDIDAEIAPMRNDNERSAIGGAFDKLGEESPTWGYTWFGLMDLATSKTEPAKYSITYDGSILLSGNYTNWNTEQPDRDESGPEFARCGALANSVRYIGKWDDLICDGDILLSSVACAKIP